MTLDPSSCSRASVAVYASQLAFLVESFGRATTTGVHTETVWRRAPA